MSITTFFTMQVPARNARSTRRAPGRQGSIVRTRVAQPARCQASQRLSRETLEFVFSCLRGFRFGFVRDSTVSDFANFIPMPLNCDLCVSRGRSWRVSGINPEFPGPLQKRSLNVFLQLMARAQPPSLLQYQSEDPTYTLHCSSFFGGTF